MALKAILLWNIFTSRQAHSNPESDEHQEPKTEDLEAQSTQPTPTQPTHPDDDDDDDNDPIPDPDDLGNDDDIINEADLEDDDDADQLDDVDPDEHPESPIRRFRPRLSISRTVTTVSTLFDPPSFRSPACLRKLKEFFSPTKSELNYFIPNYRYTPIFSGILIPFSILLEIPGLTEHWFVRTEGNQTVESRPNPPILDVALALSMLCAVIANVCLVVRFLEKRVKSMTVLCVIFLTVHDIINVLVLMIFGILHQFHDGFTYGQSFWMTVCSTVASFFTNITLIVDLIRTPNFSKSGSGLTRRQRSLVVVVILLLCYIALGAMVNLFLLGLTFINALYFTIVTIETIGFGDIHPIDTSSRVFECIYASFGILNLALAVAMTRETVLEALQVSYRKRLQHVRARRKASRQKRRIQHRWREAVQWRLRDVGAPIWVKDDFTHNALADVKWFLDQVLTWLLWPWQGYVPPQYMRYGYGRHPHGKHLNLEALTRPQLEAAALEAGVPLDTLLPPWFRSQEGGSSRAESLNGSHVGEGIFDGITSLWRGRRPGEGREQQQQPECQTYSLTYARMGRMISMLGRFALTLNEWAGPATDPPPPETPAESDDTPVSKNDSVVDGDGANDNVIEVADGKDEKDRKFRLDLDDPQSGDHISHNPPPTRFASPVLRSPSRVEVCLEPPQYDSEKLRLANEEKKAFYAQMTVACTLFLVFWTIGSGIFMWTEGWSYGIAMYFCFIAFTTIGYGDYSPQTPAGRSVFVVWALLGVGTMTILISVLSEAYSSRYKNVLTTHVFDKAVKRYRQRIRQQHCIGRGRSQRTIDTVLPSGSQAPAPAMGTQVPPMSSSSFSPSTPYVDASSHLTPSTHDPYARVQRQLESLPLDILRQAHTFQEHVRYFIGPGRGKDVLKRMPEGLKQLLSDVTDAEMIEERIKEEILQDDAARHTLFKLSIEQSLRGIVETAQDALSAIEERDHWAAQQRGTHDIENGLEPGD